LCNKDLRDPESMAKSASASRWIPDSKARNPESLRFSGARLSFRNHGELNAD